MKLLIFFWSSLDYLVGSFLSKCRGTELAYFLGVANFKYIWGYA